LFADASIFLSFQKPFMDFNQLNLIPSILQAVQEEGYTTPTPIQEQAIPIVLKGIDLLGCAQTGTGKTAAFAIPILQLLEKNKPQGKRKIRTLIVTPTRELAIQIDESFKAYGRHTSQRSAVIFGGVSQHAQVATLKNGVDILVATPGRLLDLMQQGFISLRDVEIFVLDEADRMLDMGFIHDVKKLLLALPTVRQSLFFSATMPPEIVKLSGSILRSTAQKVEVTPVSSTADTIQQFLFYVDKVNKAELLKIILMNKDIKTMLVFTRTKHGADKVVKVLLRNDITAEAIHGNKAQNARQRALTNFKNQTTRVLVATDIAARGIDVDDLQFVLNYELPNIPETYVHRIGRTGRAGAEGTSYSFCDAEEKPFLRDIEKLIKRKIEVIDNHPFPLIDHNPVKEEKPPRQPRNMPKKDKAPKPAQHNNSPASNNPPKKANTEGGNRRKW
jgi:ATP-dependent RNA helicase RhlE